jgi:hypothetical protein
VDAALQAFGLQRAEAAADAPDAGAECVYLWPELVPLWQLWGRVQTQWRTGMAGATGLDYAGVRAALPLCGVPRRKWRELFTGLQLLESEVLQVWAERAERERRS